VHVEQVIEDDVVLLTVPADVGYLGVLRTATAGLAARLHFALDEIEDLRIAVDEIEDLRIAVDEACAMLLAVASRGAELECRFSVTDDALSVEVAVNTVRGARLPAESSFAWKVLTALTSAASASVEGGRASIRLLTRRSP
jgi:serine/threonine-protein kinase RsbW